LLALSVALDLAAPSAIGAGVLAESVTALTVAKNAVRASTAAAVALYCAFAITRGAGLLHR